MQAITDNEQSLFFLKLLRETSLQDTQMTMGMTEDGRQRSLDARACMHSPH